eukprot:gene14701-biopygen9177
MTACERRRARTRNSGEPGVGGQSSVGSPRWKGCVELAWPAATFGPVCLQCGAGEFRGLQDHARTPRDGRGNGGRPGRGCSRARSLIGVPPVEARTAAAAADGHRRRVRDGVRARRRSV